ncbi:MAG: universal stress protein [Flavobacteriales bacterium]|nr:universal stress protein [Flavobacteriales bacterium]
MKKILVPIDFSAHADYASNVASQIAQTNRAQVILLHVISLPIYEDRSLLNSTWNQNEIDAINDKINDKFKSILALPDWNGIAVERKIEFGVVHKKVIEIAEQEGIDLIVAGCHGTSGENSDYVGSSIEKIVRTSKVPVLTVKKHTPKFHPKNILFVSNFFEENERALNLVSEISDKYKSDLHLTKIVTPDSFETTGYSQKLITDLAEKCGIKKFKSAIINDFEVENGVYYQAKAINADLICMATHKRTRWTRLFGKSIAQEIASHANEAVLTIKLPSDKSKTGVIFPE